MKSILVIGLGRFGKSVVKMLDEMGHQVMAVDRYEARVNEILPFATNAQIGDATERDFLSSLGVRNFDVCIVAIGDDFQSSLETTSFLKEMGAQLVVARAARGIHAKFLLRNGADEVVYPEQQTAKWTALRYSQDHILEYIEVNSEYAIFEVSVPKEWAGKTIEELDVRRKYNINIIVLKREGEMDLNVLPDTMLDGTETMLIIGSKKDVQKCSFF